MAIENFVDDLMSMASDPATPNGELIKYLIHYFSNKALPHLDSHAPVVARCSLIKNGETAAAKRCYYPPDEFKHLVPLQRANFAQEQVFYCALPSRAEGNHAMWTAIIETIHANVKDESIEQIDMILSTWVCTRPLRLWALPFSDKVCEVNPSFRDARDGMIPLISKANVPNEEAIAALKFISDAFWREDNLDVIYRITAAFYHMLKFYETQQNVNFDGLAYPSLHTQGKGINVAIKKEVIDQQIIKLEQYEYGTGLRDKNDPKRLEFESLTGPVFV